MEPKQLKSVVESLLFVSSKPLRVKEISKILEQQEFAVQAALDQLSVERKDCGVVVLENNGEYQLATNSANSTVVKNFLNAELREKLTDATVEVLAIIAYRQPISKAEIEAIRGVNSQYSLRNLLMRGLIEKIPNPQDARSLLYKTTTEFVMHLGLASVKELPEFESLVSQIKLPHTPQATEAVSPGASETELNEQVANGPIATQQNSPPQENLPVQDSATLEAEKEEFDEEDEDDDEE